MQQDILKSVYDFVSEFIEANGYPPSIREIAVGCHRDRTTVSHALGILQAQGKIARTDGKARSIRLLD